MYKYIKYICIVNHFTTRLKNCTNRYPEQECAEARIYQLDPKTFQADPKFGTSHFATRLKNCTKPVISTGV